jgi:hypothetical protein
VSNPVVGLVVPELYRGPGDGDPGQVIGLANFIPSSGRAYRLRVIFERSIALGLTDEQAEAVRDLAERSIP